MKLAEEDRKKVVNLIDSATHSFVAISTYAPMIIYSSKEDEEKVEKGLALLTEKLVELKLCKSEKELSKLLRLKKIVKGE